MSDGPHRSLPMPPGWKRVAEYSDNEAFNSTDIGHVMADALEKDFRREDQFRVITDAYQLFQVHESSLFRETLLDRLTQLRPTLGSGIGKIVLEHAIAAAHRGDSGKDAFVRVLRDAAMDRATRGARQVEEHYLREASEPRSRRVRSRIEEAITDVAVDKVAKRVLKIDETKRTGRVKHTGLDDGVPF